MDEVNIPQFDLDTDFDGALDFVVAELIDGRPAADRGFVWGKQVTKLGSDLINRRPTCMGEIDSSRSNIDGLIAYHGELITYGEELLPTADGEDRYSLDIGLCHLYGHREDIYRVQAGIDEYSKADKISFLKNAFSDLIHAVANSSNCDNSFRSMIFKSIGMVCEARYGLEEDPTLLDLALEAYEQSLEFENDPGGAFIAEAFVRMGNLKFELAEFKEDGVEWLLEAFDDQMRAVEIYEGNDNLIQVIRSRNRAIRYAYVLQSTYNHEDAVDWLIDLAEQNEDFIERTSALNQALFWTRYGSALLKKHISGRIGERDFDILKRAYYAQLNAARNYLDHEPKDRKNAAIAYMYAGDNSQNLCRGGRQTRRWASNAVRAFNTALKMAEEYGIDSVLSEKGKIDVVIYHLGKYLT